MPSRALGPKLLYSMASAYYTCNLLPLELVARSGYVPRWLGSCLRDPSTIARREALTIHPMTCPYVTRLVAAADAILADAPAEDCLIVPGGCDAMRRMGELLVASYPNRVFLLSMPRSSGPEVARSLAADLARMEKWLGERLVDGSTDGVIAGETAASSTPAAASAAAEPPRVNYPEAPCPGGIFVVGGPLSDDSLLRLLNQLGAHIAGLESCTSPDRWRPLAPDASSVNRLAQNGSDYLVLATRVLEIGMCPRRAMNDRRAHLSQRLDKAHPSSIIYARQSFCDPGAYDALLVAELANERGIPFLEIEAGFPFEVSGPLRTRVEAFLEAQLLDDDLLDDLFNGEDLLNDDTVNGED